MAETRQTVFLFANTHYNNLYLIQFLELDTKYHFIREGTAIHQNSHTTSHSKQIFTIAEGHFVCACSLEGTFNEENRWYAPPKCKGGNKTNGDLLE